jgi:hypothetical protein
MVRTDFDAGGRWGGVLVYPSAKNNRLWRPSQLRAQSRRAGPRWRMPFPDRPNTAARARKTS